MVIVKLRRCQRCKTERLVPDQIAYNHVTCRRCARRHWKALHGVRKPCHGCGSKRKRAPRTAYCERCRKSPQEYRREASARYLAKIKADPVRWAELIEAKRMNDRLRRERLGLPVRQLSPEAYHRRYGSPFSSRESLDAAPLRRLLGDWIEDFERGSAAEREQANTFARLERRTGVPARSLRRVMYEQGRVSLGTADAVCTALGTHLDLVYESGPSEALEAA